MLTTDTNFDSRNTVTQLLRSNNYPKPVINNLIHKYLNSRANVSHSNPDTRNMNQPTIYKSLVFCGTVTYALARVIKNYLPHIRLGYRCPDTLTSIFSKLKDKVAPLAQSNLIYGIPCGGCSKCYVGLTTTTMRARLSNHKSEKRRMEKMTEQEMVFYMDDQQAEQTRFPNKTALVKHTVETGHSFHYDDFRIICTERNLEKLRILEMLHINNLNTVNIKTDVEGINVQYINILKKLRCKV